MERGLASEVVEEELTALYPEVLEHYLDGIRHRARTAHVVFDVFGSFVILEVVVEDNLMDEARVAPPVVLGLRIREGDVEGEVGELTFDLAEVLFVEDLLLASCSIPVGDLTTRM